MPSFSGLRRALETSSAMSIKLSWFGDDSESISSMRSSKSGSVSERGPRLLRLSSNRSLHRLALPSLRRGPAPEWPDLDVDHHHVDVGWLHEEAFEGNGGVKQIHLQGGGAVQVRFEPGRWPYRTKQCPQDSVLDQAHSKGACGFQYASLGRQSQFLLNR